MKFIKIALVLILAIPLTGCDQIQLFGGDPTMTLAPTHEVAPGEPTSTKWVFQTSTPEYVITPKPVIPTNAPINGWLKIETDTYEIYLPESYKGGTTEENVSQLVEYFHSMGEEYKSYADTIYLYPITYKLMFVDSKKGASGFITHISLTSEPTLPAYSIDSAITSVSDGLPEGYKVVDNDLLEINGHQAAQIVAEFQSNEIPGKEIIYLIKGESAMWTLTCATAADEYNDRLLEFVQVVDSFRIK